jgi:hypothetical protein
MREPRAAQPGAGVGRPISADLVAPLFLRLFYFFHFPCFFYFVQFSFFVFILIFLKNIHI